MRNTAETVTAWKHTYRIGRTVLSGVFYAATPEGAREYAAKCIATWEHSGGSGRMVTVGLEVA